MKLYFLRYLEITFISYIYKKSEDLITVETIDQTTSFWFPFFFSPFPTEAVISYLTFSISPNNIPCFHKCILRALLSLSPSSLNIVPVSSTFIFPSKRLLEYNSEERRWSWNRRVQGAGDVLALFNRRLPFVAFFRVISVLIFENISLLG